MNKAKKLYGIMILALAMSLANTVPVKAAAPDEAFASAFPAKAAADKVLAGVVSASRNTADTALADAEPCTVCGKESG